MGKGGGLQWGKPGKTEEQILQMASLYNADAVYVSKGVCVWQCVCRCVFNEGFVKAHESFQEHLV